MTEIPPANDKLREAEFFYELMGQAFESYEFKYFTSGFLSALSGCTEHNRLLSADARFKDWYQRMKTTYLSDQRLQRLAELRNKEVHHKGTPSTQRAGMPFPDGIESATLELEIDFSKRKPVGRYKTAEMADSQEHPVKYGWYWKTEGDPDVMEVCRAGLEVVRELIRSRDEMNFKD